MPCCTVVLGYFFRGAAAPAEAAGGSSARSAGAQQGMSAAQPQPSPEQQKEMADRTATPLLENLKSNPNDSSVLVKLGSIYYDAQQFRQTIQYYEREFQKSLKSRPGHRETLFNLGVVRWQAKMDPKGGGAGMRGVVEAEPELSQRQQVLELIETAKMHGAKG
jgi:hypothetical protein